ncbi:helix-turn-helix domain-containing protein [Streptomyces sp. L7]
MGCAGDRARRTRRSAQRTPTTRHWSASSRSGPASTGRRQGCRSAEMAQRVGISKAMLSKIENAQTACSLTTLSRLARGLDVPVTALFRGLDDEREAVFVPAGHGARIVRRGTRRSATTTPSTGPAQGRPQRGWTPCWSPSTESSEVFPLLPARRHGDHHMLEGVMVHGRREILATPCAPGDALQFDGEGPHGPGAAGRVADPLPDGDGLRRRRPHRNPASISPTGVLQHTQGPTAVKRCFLLLGLFCGGVCAWTP